MDMMLKMKNLEKSHKETEECIRKSQQNKNHYAPIFGLMRH